MATTIASLITEIRDQLGDFGDGGTTLADALDASSTTVSVTSVSGITPWSWIYVDSEAMEVVSVDQDENELTVLRGGRGTTAASHAAGAVARLNLTWTDTAILAKLNEALAAAYPDLYKLVVDDTLVIQEGVIDYEVPSSIDKLCIVELEVDENVYLPVSDWELVDDSTVRIYGARGITAGTTIILRGMSRFNRATLTGNLDSDYPIEDGNARAYLITETLARCLLTPQARIAKRDAFIGITDSFQREQPYMSVNVARLLSQQAKEYLMAARMPRLVRTLPSPTRQFAF